MKLPNKSIVPLDLFFNTNSNPTRKKFRKTVSIKKFKTNTNTVTLDSNVQIKEELHQELECVLSILFWILLVEIDLTTKTHVSCHGYIRGLFRP
jgi:hypothetical protein